jgi:hypothetical protein
MFHTEFGDISVTRYEVNFLSQITAIYMRHSSSTCHAVFRFPKGLIHESQVYDYDMYKILEKLV